MKKLILKWTNYQTELQKCNLIINCDLADLETSGVAKQSKLKEKKTSRNRQTTRFWKNITLI